MRRSTLGLLIATSFFTFPCLSSAENIESGGGSSCCPVIRMDSLKTLPGYIALITVSLNDPGTIGGFDLLAAYTPGGISFLSAKAIGILEDWEYFTYRYSEIDTCSGGCLIGAIRLVGIADMPNGIAPDPAIYDPEGGIVELTFGLSSDYKFLCDCFDIRWIWLDCGDNVLSSIGGDTLFAAEDIESLLAGEDCLGSQPERTVIPLTCFVDGRICIIPPTRGEGDCNNDKIIDGVDVVYWIDYVFRDGPEPINIPVCGLPCRLDFNCDGRINLVDITAMIRYVYRQPAPGPCNTCGH